MDYYQGFNLHFPIEESDAESFMPYSCFTPLELSGIEDDPIPDYAAVNAKGKSSKSSSKSSNDSNRQRALRKKTAKRGARKAGRGHYASFHAANIGVETMGVQVQVGRADLFTYAVDPEGELSLVFLAAFQEVPVPFQQDAALLEEYKSSVQGLSLDSRTNQTAYPHYFVNNFQASDDSLHISGGDITDSIDIQIGTEKCEKEDVSFAPDFVLANSLAYRSPIDKNINFFNKDFIAADVESVQADDEDCVLVSNVNPLLNLLPEGTYLETIQTYGGSNKPITWQYEDSTISEGTPYFTLSDIEERTEFKSQAFSSLWFERGASIAAGTSETLFQLTTGEDNLFINWELSSQGVTSLSSLLNLDSLNLEMAALQIVSGEPSRYILSLNAYLGRFEQVPAPGNEGVRFEYSIYVRPKNGNGPARFMVIEALSNIPSFDPVNGPTLPSNVEHISQENIINVQSDTWSAEVTLVGGEEVLAEKAWINANDVIYWANGVADQAFFDTDLTLQSPLKATVSSITGSFTWSQYLVDPQNPIHALVYRNPIDFVIVPWFNLNALVQINPALAPLAAVKAGIYSGLAFLYGANIASGQKEPLADVVVYGKYPSSPKLAMNFEIPEENVKDLEKMISLPDDYKIIPMQMSVDSPSKYMLTVEVFSTSVFGGTPYDKATWTVYVMNGEGRTLLHEFHVEYSTQGIDVEEILKPPAQVFMVAASTDVFDVTIKSPSVDISFQAPLTSNTAQKVDVADSWVHSHDRVLWEKGIYDDVYYNGGLWDAQLIPVDAGDVVYMQDASWADLISDNPFEVFYFDSDFHLVSSPWKNIEEINA